MLEHLHATLTAEHDFLEALAALATVFALVVPLPIFVVSTLRQRKAERRQRTYSLLEKMDNGEARALRDRVLKVMSKYDLSSPGIVDRMADEDRDDIRQFMNTHELVGMLLNETSIDREMFIKLWRTAYARDWDKLRPFAAQLRERFGPDLFVEWERAANRARDYKAAADVA